jgi:hypothetical protein
MITHDLFPEGVGDVLEARTRFGFGTFRDEIAEVGLAVQAQRAFTRVDRAGRIRTGSDRSVDSKVRIDVHGNVVQGRFDQG